MKKFTLVILLAFFSGTSGIYAQTGCSTASFYIGVNAVNAKDILCLSKTSDKDKTLFFTFGIWCSPCRHHLPNAMKLAKDKNLDFYVLLIEKENSDKTKKAIDYLKAIDSSMKILVLKDSSYGTAAGKKYKKFLKEITPPQFENIDGMSKYIVIDRNEKVLMVTNWKKKKKNDWKDDSEMIKTRILPVLQ